MTTITTAPTKKETQRQPAQQAVPAWARVARNLLWAPIVVAGVVICAEILLRLGHVGEEQVWHPDSSFGLIGLPGQDFTFRSEGYSAGKFNSDGFNDREFSLKKPSGTLRICVLGDSKTEAMQVPRDFNYAHLLESKLNKAGKHVEVLNFGVSAFTPGQEYLLYLSKVAQYKPDVLIVMLNAGDPEELIKPAGPVSGIFPRPYFVLNPDSSLHIDWSVVDDHLNNPKAQLMKRFESVRTNSRIWGLLEKVEPTVNKIPAFKWLAERVQQLCTPSANESSVHTYAQRERYLDNFEKSPYGAPLPDSTKAMHADFQPKNDVQLQHSFNNSTFKVTQSIYYRLNELCRQNNCRLLVVGAPSLSNEMYYVRQLNDMEQLAKERGFAFINLQKVFPPQAPMQKSPYFYPSLHFNASGHELVAQTIYDQLEPTLPSHQ